MGGQERERERERGGGQIKIQGIEKQLYCTRYIDSAESHAIYMYSLHNHMLRSSASHMYMHLYQSPLTFDARQDSSLLDGRRLFKTEGK